MLAFLAATVPIVGSLYVALSYLIEKAEVDHEFRVRRRLIPMRDERFHRLLPEAKARATRMNRPFDMDVFMHELDATDDVLYAANGVRPPTSYRMQALNASMSRPLPSRRESHRQWILLISSAAGLVLLAFEVMA